VTSYNLENWEETTSSLPPGYRFDMLMTHNGSMCFVTSYLDVYLEYKYSRHIEKVFKFEDGCLELQIANNTMFHLSKNGTYSIYNILSAKPFQYKLLYELYDVHNFSLNNMMTSFAFRPGPANNSSLERTCAAVDIIHSGLHSEKVSDIYTQNSSVLAVPNKKNKFILYSQIESVMYSCGTAEILRHPSLFWNDMYGLKHSICATSNQIIFLTEELGERKIQILPILLPSFDKRINLNKWRAETLLLQLGPYRT
jgi:hypothetical protein